MDLEAARLEANETARPWGSKGPSPDEVWRSRKPITHEERDAFRRAVTKFSRSWRKFVVGTKVRSLRADRTVPGSKPGEEVTQAEEDEVMRKSIGSGVRVAGPSQGREG